MAKFFPKLLARKSACHHGSILRACSFYRFSRFAQLCLASCYTDADAGDNLYLYCVPLVLQVQHLLQLVLFLPAAWVYVDIMRAAFVACFVAPLAPGSGFHSRGLLLKLLDDQPFACHYPYVGPTCPE